MDKILPKFKSGYMKKDALAGYNQLMKTSREFLLSAEAKHLFKTNRLPKQIELSAAEMEIQVKKEIERDIFNNKNAITIFKQYFEKHTIISKRYIIKRYSQGCSGHL